MTINPSNSGEACGDCPLETLRGDTPCFGQVTLNADVRHIWDEVNPRDYTYWDDMPSYERTGGEFYSPATRRTEVCGVDFQTLAHEDAYSEHSTLGWFATISAVSHARTRGAAMVLSPFVSFRSPDPDTNQFEPVIIARTHRLYVATQARKGIEERIVTPDGSQTDVTGWHPSEEEIAGKMLDLSIHRLTSAIEKS